MTQKDTEKIAKRLLKEMRDEAGKPSPSEEHLLRTYPFHGLKMTGSQAD